MPISKKAQAAADLAMSIDVPFSKAGLGVDIVEVERMALALKRTPTFEEKTFSEDERQYCNARPNPAMHFAARFAAKEAVVKALGCGFSQGVGVRDIEVAHGQGGRPIVLLHGRATQIAVDQGVGEIALSISHTGSDAIACAIAIRDKTLQPRGKEDSKAELARKFKEARGMLDSIGKGDREQDSFSEAHLGCSSEVGSHDGPPHDTSESSSDHLGEKDA